MKDSYDGDYRERMDRWNNKGFVVEKNAEVSEAGGKEGKLKVWSERRASKTIVYLQQLQIIFRAR